jgi:hypothetical protein
VLQKKLYPNQSIILLDKDEQFRVCKGYDLLGDICYSKGETEKAINHLRQPLGLHLLQTGIITVLDPLLLGTAVFHKEGRFGDAHAHIECAKSHAVNDPFLLGRAMEQQAEFWYKEGKLEEAKSEVLCATWCI